MIIFLTSDYHRLIDLASTNNRYGSYQKAHIGIDQCDIMIYRLVIVTGVSLVILKYTAVDICDPFCEKVPKVPTKLAKIITNLNTSHTTIIAILELHGATLI